MNENARKTVLIIEDERIVGIMAKAMLESLGYDAIHCVDAKSGVESFKTIHHDIAFVLLDLLLPDMGGKLVYRKLRDIDPDLKCIVSSGMASDDPIQELLAEGANDFIHKPFRRAALQAVISRVLGTS